MNHHEDRIGVLRDLVTRLTESSLAEIDFDAIRSAIEQAIKTESTLHELACEHAQLRDDYVARIAGMAKALAVAKASDRGVSEASALVEALPSMRASQLIEQYRKTSALFRDSFPASFGQQATRYASGSRTVRYADYK